MRKILIIYFFMISNFIFSYSKKEKELIKIIENNVKYSCNFIEKTTILEGENFIGHYYNNKPYGSWELKNGKVKQCFLNKEKKFYYKNKYYIVDNNYYYFKINYESNILLIKNKKKNKIYYFKKDKKKIIRIYNVTEDIIFPKLLHDLILLEVKKLKRWEDYFPSSSFLD